MRTLLIASLLIRLMLACGLQWYLDQQGDRDFLIAGDAAGYWELAQDIAGGKPYEVHEPPRQIHRMPGFPVMLSVPISLFGSSYLMARLWLALIGTIAVYLCYRLALELADVPTAISSGWLVGLHPVLTGFSVVLLSETCFAAALLASLWGFHRLQITPQSYSFAILAGVLAALATYMRPVWLLFPLIWGVYQLVVNQNRLLVWRNLLLVLLGLGAGLAPWVYRNYQVSDQLVVTTLWGGPSLYDGLSLHATGESDMRFFDRDGLSATMSEYEVDQEYRNRAWQFVADHPVRTLQLAGQKAVRFWRPWPAAEEVSFPLLAGFIGVLNLGLFFCAVAALWKFRREGTLLFFTFSPIIYFAVIHLLFVGSMRYRLPAEYPLMILVAVLCSKCLFCKKICGDVAGDEKCS
ncbi:MAG: glycosyltransferase family 39 protein [Planctomycetaceae bacterium]|nr:glycosyltransferase family 39 protein [Planctomycetaceae bacterium]